MSFDRNSTADLAALKSEVENDPNGKGYDPLGGTQDLLDLLNAKTETVSKPMISSNDIRAVTYYQAYNTLAQDEQEWLVWITSSGNENDVTVTADLRERLTGETGGGSSNSSIWANSQRSTIEPLMLALIDVPGSRAEVLFGFGTNISRDDWFAARDSA